MRIILKDENGDPFEGTTVVTVYDKSLEAIAGGPNTRSIQDFFWNWTRPFYRANLRHSQYMQGIPLGKAKVARMQSLGKYGNLVADLVGSGVSSVRVEGAAFGAGALKMRAAPMAANMAEVAADEAAIPDSPVAQGIGGGGPEDGPRVMVRSKFADLV